MNVPKLRFKEFNDEWRKDILSHICTLTSSKRIYLHDYVSKGIPFYRGKEISELKMNKEVTDLLYILENKYNEIKYKFGVPQKNDILITGVGTLGNIYRVPNNNPFYFKDGNLIWLKDIKVNSHFLEYSLEYNKKNIVDSAIGSTQKALTIVQLSKLVFSYPNSCEQEKIGTFLSLLDKKIELQSKKIEALKLYKMCIKKVLFKDKKNWDSKNIFEVLDFEQPNKYLVYSEDYTNDKTMIPVLTANKGFILGYCNEDNYYNKGDSIIFDDFTMDMKYTNFPYKIKSSAIKILTPKNNNNLKFLYESLLSLNLSSEEHKRHYISIVQSMVIQVPNIDIQNKIAKILSIYDKKIELEKLKFEKLESLKKGLMQNMFV